MAIKLSKKDYIWSYIGVFLSLFSSVLMLPFVVYYLDGDHYGLWGVFQSLIAITNLFDFGFATTFARNINYSWCGAEALKKTDVVFSKNSEPNFLLMKKTMAACKMVFLIVSTAASLLLLTVGTFYVSYISKEMNSGDVLPAWLICVVGIFMNLYFGYFGSFLRGVGAMKAVNMATVFAKLIQIAVTIVFLYLGFGLIGTSLAYLSYGSLFLLLSRRSFYNYHGIGQSLKAVTSKIDLGQIKEMFFIVWYNAWREGLVSLSNYLANQACTIIISLYMPLTQTGAYAMGVQLANAVAQISGTMYTVNQPVLQSAYVSGDSNKLRRTMSLIVYSFVSLYVCGTILVIFAALPILRLIRPETVVPPTVMLGLSLYQFILKFRNCYTSYFSCTNRIPYVKAFLISSVACVILSLFTMGVLHAGVWGIILSQIVSQAAYNGWIWASKAHSEMELSLRNTISYGREELVKLLCSFLRKGESTNV